MSESKPSSPGVTPGKVAEVAAEIMPEGGVKAKLPAPPPMSRKMVTVAEAMAIAQSSARKEIARVSASIGKGVEDAMAQALHPLNQKFERLMQEQAMTSITLNAMMEIMIDKKLCTKEELEAKVKEHTKVEMEKWKKMLGQRGVLGTAVADPDSPAAQMAEDVAVLDAMPTEKPEESSGKPSGPQ